MKMFTGHNKRIARSCCARRWGSCLSVRHELIHSTTKYELTETNRQFGSGRVLLQCCLCRVKISRDVSRDIWNFFFLRISKFLLIYSTISRGTLTLFCEPCWLVNHVAISWIVLWNSKALRSYVLIVLSALTVRTIQFKLSWLYIQSRWHNCTIENTFPRPCVNMVGCGVCLSSFPL